ncbi:MAG: alanine racemase [FCB group bacterium]|nr:alanine racemase [FCB group bacterium]
MMGPKAIIHLDRLRDNIRAIRQRVGKTPLMGVVKANAYGHGAVAVTRALQDVGISFFAVFTIEEARELRAANIQDPILVFSHSQPENFQEAVESNIHLNLCAPDDLPKIQSFCASYGASPVFHLKLDTGMTRLGLSFEEAVDVLRQSKTIPGLRIDGCYSHYSTADEGDLHYAHEQHRRFEEFLARADSMGIRFAYTHFSNSGAVLNLPESYYNLVRVGMLMYGAFPSDEVPTDIPIQPVMEFRGPIVSVRRVSAGTPVSYGGVYVTKQETTIGVIQTGFADGFPRPWYEQGHVMYKGQPYRIAGRVCMDQFMVDFGDTRPLPGEEVLLFGEGADGRLTVDEIAKKTGMTTYMLLTAIGGRTRREFADGN